MLMNLNLWAVSLFALCLQGTSCSHGKVVCRNEPKDFERWGPFGGDNRGYKPPCGAEASGTCLNCPAGTFVLFNGTENFQERCAPCPAGRYGNVAGAWGIEEGCPEFCPAGKYVRQRFAFTIYENHFYYVPGAAGVLEEAWSSGTFPTTDVLCKDTCTDVLDLQEEGPRCGKTQECHLPPTLGVQSGVSNSYNEIALLKSNGGKVCVVCEDGFHKPSNRDNTGPTVSLQPTPGPQQLTCTANRICNPGYAIDAKGTNASDQTCKRCPMGRFNGNFNSDSCKELTICNATTEKMVAQGTHISDTLCISIPAIGPKGDPGARGFNGGSGPKGDPGARGFNGSAGVCPSNCRSLKRHDNDITPSGVDGNGSPMSFLADVEPWMLAFFALCGVMLVSMGLMCKYVSELKGAVLKLQNQIEGTQGKTQAANRNSWDMRKILNNAEHNFEMRPIKPVSESAIGLSIGRELPKPMVTERSQPTRRSLLTIESPGQWMEYVDESTKKPYYHNDSTGATQWEKPDVMFERV